MVSREFPPETHIGGIGTYTYKTSAALARLGHEVHVITASHKPSADYVENGVSIHRIQDVERRGRAPYALIHARAVANAIARISSQLDIVQACEWGGEAFWYALALRRRVPLVTRLATPLFVVQRLNEMTAQSQPGQGQLTRTMERMQTVRSDGIISPTHALAKIVCDGWRISPERVTVVPTGAHIEQSVDAQVTTVPQEIGASRYLLYFGRLEPRKGVHILAEALPDILDAYPDMKAVFVGEDLSFEGRPMADVIRERCERHADRLVFLPRMTQSELFPIIRAARLVVLPSLWENLANTCLEAMQLGRPVVATWGCGFEEVIEDGVSGFLAAPGDVESLRMRIRAALDDEAYAEQVGAAAQRRAAEFNVDAMADRLVAYYQHLLSMLGQRQMATRRGTLAHERRGFTR